MSETTTVTTLADLSRDFLFRLREKSGVTETDNAATRFINTALVNMHVSPGANLPWAERRAVLITRAPYTTGTVDIDISVSRTAVTGTDTLWTTNDDYGIANARAGGKMKFANREVYEVSAVGGATSITLATQYTGTEDLDDDSYTYFEDEYSLASDFSRFVDIRMFSYERNIPLIGRSEFRRTFPRNDIARKPAAATLIQKIFSGSTTPVYRVVLGPPPDAAYSFPYAYITTNLAVSAAGAAQAQLSATTDEPIVPLLYRHGIVLWALKEWFRDRKDDARADKVNGEYVDFMSRMLGDTQVGQDRPQFVMRRRSRIPRRGRFDVGGRFDSDPSW